jgi:hypothetical protein
MSVFAAIVSARCDDAAPVTTAPREKQAITSLRHPFQRTDRANHCSVVRASQAAFGAWAGVADARNGRSNSMQGKRGESISRLGHRLMTK